MERWDVTFHPTMTRCQSGGRTTFNSLAFVNILFVSQIPNCFNCNCFSLWNCETITSKIFLTFIPYHFTCYKMCSIYFWKLIVLRFDVALFLNWSLCWCDNLVSLQSLHAISLTSWFHGLISMFALGKKVFRSSSVRWKLFQSLVSSVLTLSCQWILQGQVESLSQWDTLFPVTLFWLF